MVRQATFQDLERIAEIHKKCFPDSFSTRLGHLEEFYTVYMKKSPELFLVGETEGKIEGFCMGYYLENTGFMKVYVKQNILPLGFKMIGLLLSGDKVTWKKVKNLFKRGESFKIVNEKYKNFQNKEIGDLLSICVLPDVRGKGLANELMESYLTALRTNGRKICFLTVDVKNERAIRFYIRHHFEPYKEIPGQCRTYARYI